MPRHSRDPKLEHFWRRHLTQQPASGLTIRDYCRKHALQEPSFYVWRRTISERDRAARPAPDATPATQPKLAFLPVACGDPLAQCSAAIAPAAAIDIRLANGCRIRVRAGCDRSLLADVLAMLQASAGTEGRPC